MMRKIVIIVVSFLIAICFVRVSSAQMTPDDIKAIQKAIAEKGLNWRAGETDITKLSEDVRRAMLGAIPPEPGSPATPRYGIEKLARQPLPPQYTWGGSMTPIRDQGQCGSCWAFAVAGTFEPVIAIHYPGQTGLDISEQNMVSCWRGSCEGYYVDSALKYFEEQGCPDEACFPYVSGNGYVPPCTDRCAGWQQRASYVRAWGRYNQPGIETMKAEIMHHGPVVTLMEVYEDFNTYSGGVYAHATGLLKGFHAVVIYGWDDYSQCWLAKNSWGTNWGEAGPGRNRGWFRIRMGNDECGCESYVYWMYPWWPVPPQVPSLTVSGLAVLCVLLLLATIFIMRRRRVRYAI